MSGTHEEVLEVERGENRCANEEGFYRGRLTNAFLFEGKYIQLALVDEELICKAG